MTTSKYVVFFFKKKERLKILQISSIKNIRGGEMCLSIFRKKQNKNNLWCYFNFESGTFPPWCVPWFILKKIALHTKLCFMYKTQFKNNTKGRERWRVWCGSGGANLYLSLSQWGTKARAETMPFHIVAPVQYIHNTIVVCMTKRATSPWFYLAELVCNTGRVLLDPWNLNFWQNWRKKIKINRPTKTLSFPLNEQADKQTKQMGK